MGLPKIEKPIFSITLPSNGKTIQYTPFTVKEEKILLIAQESKNTDQISTAIKQVISNCIIDYDVNDMAVFDIEYVLLNLRAKSVNNLFEFKIKDPDTGEEIEIEFDVDEIQIEKDNAHTNKIQLTDDMILIMKYPTINQLDNIIESIKSDDTNSTIDLMVSCFDYVAENDSVYKISEYTDKEILEFVDSFSGKNAQDIKRFFSTMPSLKLEKKYKRKDGTEKTFVLKGTQTFFI